MCRCIFNLRVRHNEGCFSFQDEMFSESVVCANAKVFFEYDIWKSLQIEIDTENADDFVKFETS